MGEKEFALPAQQRLEERQRGGYAKVMLSLFSPKAVRARGRGMVCITAALLAGCQREGVRVYEAPKDAPAVEVAQNETQKPETDAAPHPEVAWKLPAGWNQIPTGQFSLATFSVTNASGAEAQSSITLLGRLAGHEAMVVNMWREESGMPDLADDAALKELRPVFIGAENGNLFEVSGSQTNEKTGKTRPFQLITAFVNRPEGSWFFRISGDPPLVTEQRPAFVEFLKSIRFTAPSDSQPALAATQPADDTQKFNWTVPADWKAVAPGQMQVARFDISHNGKAATQVFISVFDTDTGGMLANVNRWRRLVDLANPITEAEMPQITSPLDPLLPGALLVDVANNNKRLVGAIVPREGKYWFYRMLGEPAVLGAEKDAFVAFAKSKP